MKITILGAGSWGTAIAKVLAEKHGQVTLWTRGAEHAQEMQRVHENRKYLPGVNLPEGVHIETDRRKAVEGANLIIVVVPSLYMREVLTLCAPFIAKDAVIINAAKGIEHGTGKRLSQVIEEVLGKRRIAVLSGPNHAEEVGRSLPTAAVIASEDAKLRKELPSVLSTERFKVYPHDDVVGVEVCGAVKNIIAIVVGATVGLGFGDNAMGSIITYGMMEMNTLGRHMGAKRKTIYGLAGVGDLVATCASKKSRNRFFGEQLAAGRSREEIEQAMNGMVAEGVFTAKVTHEFALKHKLKMPLTEQVYEVIFEKKNIKKAAEDLIRLL